MSSIDINPQAEGFVMPAEWASQQAVWMIWPYRTDNWRSNGRPAQLAFANVAAAIATKTPVFMAVPAAEMANASELMTAPLTLGGMKMD